MSADTLASLITLIPSLIVLLVILSVALLVVVVGGLMLARQFIPALRDSVPADFGHKSLDLAKAVLMFGLNTGAAKTPSLDDDQALIKGLQLLGAEVNGNPETGYTIVVPPKPAA